MANERERKREGEEAIVREERGREGGKGREKERRPRESEREGKLAMKRQR